mgnify:CR=1 FL=1
MALDCAACGSPSSVASSALNAISEGFGNVRGAAFIEKAGPRF